MKLFPHCFVASTYDSEDWMKRINRELIFMRRPGHGAIAGCRVGICTALSCSILLSTAALLLPIEFPLHQDRMWTPREDPTLTVADVPFKASTRGGESLLLTSLLCAAIFQFTSRFRRKTGEEEANLLRRKLEESESRLKEIEAELGKNSETLRSIQQKLIAADALAALGQLTAGIAHEIRNPINFVNNFAESLVDMVAELRDEIEHRHDNPDEARKRIHSLLGEFETSADKIREHGGRVDSIVRSMLLHSHGKQGQFESVNLNGFLDQYVTLAFHGMRAQVADFSVRIDREYDPALGTISVIRPDLARVFVNLLNNAFQAVEDLKHDTGDAYEPLVCIRTLRTDFGCSIIFDDNGPGVPEHLRSKIFEAFFTTKEEGRGTGLGLPLSHQIIVEGHRGRFHCEESPFGGARFIIELPI